MTKFVQCVLGKCFLVSDPPNFPVYLLLVPPLSSPPPRLDRGVERAEVLLDDVPALLCWRITAVMLKTKSDSIPVSVLILQKHKSLTGRNSIGAVLSENPPVQPVSVLPLQCVMMSRNYPQRPTLPSQGRVVSELTGSSESWERSAVILTLWYRVFLACHRPASMIIGQTRPTSLDWLAPSLAIKSGMQGSLGTDCVSMEDSRSSTLHNAGSASVCSILPRGTWTLAGFQYTMFTDITQMEHKYKYKTMLQL